MSTREPVRIDHESVGKNPVREGSGAVGTCERRGGHHHRGEASRRMWDEFDRTEPLRESEVTDEQADVTLEKKEATPVAAEE